MNGGTCSGFVECLWAFQTLVAGVLAMAIAAVTACVLLHAARVPVVAKQKERQENDLLRVRLRCLELSEEYSMLHRRAKQGQGTVKVYKAANKEVSEIVLQRMMLSVPTSTQDWQFMSMIPEELARRCISLNGTIHDHNFDMERTGGAFGDDNFGQLIVERLKRIEHETSNLRSTFSNYKLVAEPLLSSDV